MNARGSILSTFLSRYLKLALCKLFMALYYNIGRNTDMIPLGFARPIDYFYYFYKQKHKWLLKYC